MIDLDAVLADQRAAAATSGPPTADERVERIGRLIEAIGDHVDELTDALATDYGQRGPVQSMGTDVTASLTALRHSQKRLRRWMRERRSPAGRVLAVGGIRTRIAYQPLGVVGIVSPWNFPVTLSLHPLGQAFAAGNRAMLKVSEVTATTGGILQRVLSDAFDPAELVVVGGGPEVAEAFCHLPFDHLFFTGSTATGRRVMQAAATNLVPVTLELGGQCPVAVGPDAALDRVASTLVFGKTLNAGQFCVAPDHVYVPRDREAAFVDAASAAGRRLYPGGMDDTATAIVNDAHHRRLLAHIDDARAKGATVVELAAAPTHGRRLMPPTLLLGVDETMTACHEELFGPVLPVHTYERMDEVIDRINAGPRPLAAYYFGGDSPDRRAFLERTVSGGVTINDIMLHVGLEGLPFGGVGASGMGRYHGRAGFETFSHAKVIVEGPRRPLTRFAHPPYPATARRALRWHATHTADRSRRRSARS